MTYARLISEFAIDTNVPRLAKWNGKLVTGDLSVFPGLLESLRYYLVQTSEAPTPQEGYHNEPRYAYDDAEHPTVIVQSWEVVQDSPPPPRSLSKVKLMRALKARSLWISVKAFIEASEDYADEWALSTTLDEDNALIVSAVAALKQSLGLTDEQVETILSASVAE